MEMLRQTPLQAVDQFFRSIENSHCHRILIIPFATASTTVLLYYPVAAPVAAVVTVIVPLVGCYFRSTTNLFNVQPIYAIRFTMTAIHIIHGPL